MISDPLSFILDPKEFLQTVISPIEAIQAYQEDLQLNGALILDYKAILELPDNVFGIQLYTF